MPAIAADDPQLEGVVTGFDGDRAIVHHGPFDAMPEMTMEFSVDGGIGTLRAGDEILARVDEHSDPWRLHDVNVLAHNVPTSASRLAGVKPSRIGDAMPAGAFLDQNGRPWSFADVKGYAAVVAFIYTRCRDPRMCPLISSKFHTLQAPMGARNARLIEVTLDPAFDRPDVLKRYAAQFAADPKVWTLLTGDPKAVVRFAASFGVVPVAKGTLGNLVHGERVAIVSPDGTIADFIDNVDWTPEDMLAAVDRAAGRPTSIGSRIGFEARKLLVTFCGLAGVPESVGWWLLGTLSPVLLVGAYFVGRGVWRMFARRGSA